MECCSVVETDLIGKTLSMWFHLIRLITLLCYWGIYLLVVYLGIITWGVVTSRWSYRLSQSLRPGPPRNWVFPKVPTRGPPKASPQPGCPGTQRFYLIKYQGSLNAHTFVPPFLHSERKHFIPVH